MKLPRTAKRVSRNGTTYVLRRAALSGLSQPANEPPADDPADDKGDVGDEDKSGKGDKTITQAEMNRISAREKAAGKRAALKELADGWGISIEEAKAIIDKHNEAEDAKKSDADKSRDKATKELSDAEKAKREAAEERHEARIERALNAVKFDGDEKALARVRRIVTVEVGSSYEDILADVKAAQEELPGLFESKTSDGDKDPGKGKLPSSDPAGKPPKPKGGEDKFSAGQKRFEEQAAKKRGYNPLDKQPA